MGYGIKATCSDCGLKKDLTFGAGMLNFQKECWSPAVNEKGNLVSADMKKKENQALKFYARQFENEAEDVFDTHHQWHFYWLPKEKNHCPNCNKETLSFKVSAMFD